MTVTRTLAVPARRRSISRAAARERSMTRPLTNGPRSVMRTSVSFFVARRRTRTHVSNGSVGWAAVNRSMSKTSPLAARRPWYGSPYQLAMPSSIAPMRAAGTRAVARREPQAESSVRKARAAMVSEERESLMMLPDA